MPPHALNCDVLQLTGGGCHCPVLHCPTAQAIYADVSASRKTTGAGRYRDRDFFVNPGVLHAYGAAPALQAGISTPLPGADAAKLRDVVGSEDGAHPPSWMVSCRACEADGVALDAQLRNAAAAAAREAHGSQEPARGGSQATGGTGTSATQRAVDYHPDFHVHNVSAST